MRSVPFLQHCDLVRLFSLLVPDWEAERKDRIAQRRSQSAKSEGKVTKGLSELSDDL